MEFAGRNIVVTGGFFVLPHREVADYMAPKATDPERWLGGMRKLQRRTIGA